MKIIKNIDSKIYIFVGDPYQIESIQFGLWFDIISSICPKIEEHELKEVYRTTENQLIEIWNSTRECNEDIIERLCRFNHGLKSIDNVLGNVLSSRENSIVLSLSYGGLYGVNNINYLCQINNQNDEYEWKMIKYRVGDPIIFNENGKDQWGIYNNLRGNIKKIELGIDNIVFDIELEKLEWGLKGDVTNEYEGHNNTIIRINVVDNDDYSLDQYNYVPFDISYCMTIHKSQGLEYGDVHLIIDDEAFNTVNHNIFYTAITRAKSNLKIYSTDNFHFFIKRIKSEKDEKINNIQKQVNIIKNNFLS